MSGDTRTLEKVRDNILHSDELTTGDTINFYNKWAEKYNQVRLHSIQFNVKSKHGNKLFSEQWRHHGETKEAMTMNTIGKYPS